MNKLLIFSRVVSIIINHFRVNSVVVNGCSMSQWLRRKQSNMYYFYKIPSSKVCMYILKQFYKTSPIYFILKFNLYRNHQDPAKSTLKIKWSFIFYHISQNQFSVCSHFEHFRQQTILRPQNLLYFKNFVSSRNN